MSVTRYGISLLYPVNGIEMLKMTGRTGTIP